MKQILIWLGLLGFAIPLSNTEIPVKTEKIEPKKPEYRTIVARVTYYSPNEKNYKWGTRISSNPKGKAISSWTVAVDPKKIPYGTTLYIPALEQVIGDGIFRAEDTGRAVKSMKAIGQNKRAEIHYVIDVFVDNNDKMNILSKTMPQYMEVYIYE